MVYRRVVLALLLVLSILVGGYGLAVNVSPIAPELYESEFSGNITGFKAENYGLPLVVLFNGGEYGVKVSGEVVNTSTVSITDMPNGTYSFTNVVSMDIDIDVESRYVLYDDDIYISISNGISNITILIDEGSDSESFFDSTTNWYDSIRIIVDGYTVYSIDAPA